MRYPYNNFTSEWNTTAGYGFGAKTDYGYHEGQDVNDNYGGNADYGKPIHAITDGVVTSVHTHTTTPTFGKHLHYKIEGAWGVRWVHHAHCSEILVNEGDTITEGQLIARIGNSGTVWAHDHWAIKKAPTGIDAIAKTKADLDNWEDPVAFVTRWMGTPGGGGNMDLQAKYDALVEKHEATLKLLRDNEKANGEKDRYLAERDATIANLNQTVNDRNADITKLNAELTTTKSQLQSAEQSRDSYQELAKQVPTLKEELEQALTDRRGAFEQLEATEKVLRGEREEKQRLIDNAPLAFWNYLLARFKRGGDQ